jgi:mRNA-degrading endonuclease RelE of RelBE toxin-antitoxin system
MRIKRMQLTKLRAAPVLQAEVPPCALAGQMDGGTGSQLIRSVRPTRRGVRESGYNVARVRFEIILSPEAGNALAALPAHTRSEVRDGIEVHLRYEPTKLSKSRIKRLRGLERPQFRLRVGEMRVFYDATEAEVHVLAIISKSEAQAWLDDQGIPAPPGGPGEGEG